jgi:hypothetical protein
MPERRGGQEDAGRALPIGALTTTAGGSVTRNLQRSTQATSGSFRIQRIAGRCGQAPWRGAYPHPDCRNGVYCHADRKNDYVRAIDPGGSPCRDA